MALFATFLLPWYTTDWTQGSSSVQQGFYLTSMEVRSNASSNSGTQFLSYAAAGMPNTGGLYATVAILILTVIVLAALTAILTLPRRSGTRPHWTLLVALLTCVIAFAVPIGLALDQPAAACADAQHFPTPTGPHPGPSGAQLSSTSCSWWMYDGSGGAWSGGLSPGPQTAFFGPSSPNAEGFQWGPAIGFWVLVASDALLVTATMSTWLSAPYPHPTIEPRPVPG